MIWTLFPWFAALHLGLDAAAVLAVVRRRERTAWALLAVSALVLGSFLVGIWIDMGRPPLRTYGETRLVYALGLGVLSVVSYALLRQAWSLVYGASMTALFVALTWILPESHSRALMPALRSPWFVPHVTVYLLGYAAATATSAAALFNLFKPVPGGRKVDGLLSVTTVLLSCGLLFGALWAKQAWGSYWTWDPKETWAFLTWASYLGALHWRKSHPSPSAGLGFLVVAWGVLLLAWFAVGYLPGGVNSVHTYTR